MMTPRLTVAAVGEDEVAEVADCASEFARGFDSEAGSGADFVSSDLRHMGHLHGANSEGAVLGVPGNREPGHGSTREIRCKEGIERRNVEGERKKQVPLLRALSECCVRGFVWRFGWYDFAP
jgi:hypothetical protein